MEVKPLDWLLLISTLPGQNGALRIRFWRALKGLGAGCLRDGVYALPDRPEFREAFTAQQRDITESGGTAYVLSAASQAQGEDASLRSLFDRGEQYTSFIAEAEELLTTVGKGTESAARRRLRQMSRGYESIEAIDFFGSAGQDRARAVLSSLGNAVAKAFSPDEPSATSAAILRLDRAEYQKRVWATRRRLWVDRVASAWLILRFIDSEATFQWLADAKQSPPDALGFDFDGATFTHVGELTTFEVLLATFGLDRDAGLAKIAMIVHSLDVGGQSVPEAAGFEALLGGARDRSRNDDELLSRMADVLDSLYEAFRL
ncbi:MAG: chromate resistance protein [bacterium]|nr:chromate resistance protein [bacterium]